MSALSMARRNGIPVIGLGTYPLRGKEAETAIALALELGIRHIDTAQMYGNESDVGQAIKSCGIARAELFVVTKVDPGNTGKTRFAESVARSMADLGSPADLLLIHWPPPAEDFDAALERLVAEKQKGMARAIGVSNFSGPMMQRAQALSGGAITCNQVEFHPLLDQSRLLDEAGKLGIALTAYSPLARGRALKHQTVQEVARRTGRAASEVVLRWIIQQGVVAIPMTTKRANALSNLRALEFELSSSDMAALSGIGTSQGRTINPSWMTGRWEDGLT